MKKLYLKLKDINTDNQHTQRILQLTAQSIELLNNYAEDFFETIEILNENKSSKSKKKTEVKEINTSITYVKGRIKEVNKSMKQMVKEMPELIEICEK